VEQQLLVGPPCSARRPIEIGRGRLVAEGIGQSMARGLPELVGYLGSQMQAGRLRRMNPVIAVQLLAGPIVVHLRTRPLAETFTGFDAPQSEVLEQIVHAWLLATAPDGRHGVTRA
jgi:hypothetical protein